MAFKLPVSVYSPALIESVQYEVGQYMDWYRESKVHAKVGVPGAEEPSFAAETRQTIEAWFEDGKPTLSGLEDLQKHLRGLNLPVAHVTLAALPNHLQRTQLVDWFRNNTSSETLVSFVADRNLGGGIIVRTPNRVIDLSWRQKLVEGRSKLAEIVRNV